MSIKRIITLVLISILAVSAACLAADESALFKGKTESVSVFKNGIGFFMRGGEAKLTDGWATSDVIPEAALGTYWIASSKKGVAIESLIASREDMQKSIPASEIWQLLKSNVDKLVSIKVADKNYNGRILSVQDREPVPPGPGEPFNYDGSSPLLVLDTEQGTLCINCRMIDSVLFFDKPNTDYNDKTSVNRLKFKVSGAGSSAPVTIGYLQKGITWSPAYLIELKDDKTARMTMQGLLVNDAEDLKGTDVNFVVGYPNFVFSDIVSPLALKESVNQFITSLGRGRTSISSTPGIMTQSIAYNIRYSYAESSEEGFDYSAATQTPGEAQEDLFIYNIDNVDLKKGERAYYTIFSADVPFKHRYDADLPDISGIQSTGYAENRQNPVPPVYNVWHKLILTNSTAYPWTTAPAMAIKGDNPISQDIINYTSKGEEGELKITIASDIKVTLEENEISREDVSKEFKGHNTYKVFVEGKISLSNNKAEKVPLRIKKKITGEVIETSDNGKTKKSAEGVKSINPSSEITWELSMGDNTSKEVRYRYYTYLRY